MDRIPAAPGATDDEMLHGGEEYELIITAASLPASIDDVTLTRVGEIVPSTDEHRILLVDGPDETVLVPKGWQHFPAK